VATGKHAAAAIEIAPRWAGSAEPDAKVAHVGEAAAYIAKREGRA
jgi:hypothetical protein